MPTSTIVLLVVRLFSLQWLVQGLTMLVAAFAMFDSGSRRSIITAEFLPPVLVLALAVIAWFIAPMLSRLIPGKQDVAIAVSGLTVRDLYSFAFVFLGLYFALSSLGQVLVVG